MKHTFQWLLAAVCLFVVGNASVMADDEEVKLPILIGTGEVLTGDGLRGVVAVPFAAYYQGGTIYISTSAELSVITIAVENKTTGQVWNTTTDISDGMGEICISDGDSGGYTIEIVTEYGECFVGEFSIK